MVASGLGRWCCNPEVPGSRLPSPSSNPRSRFVNSQLVCQLGFLTTLRLFEIFVSFSFDQWHIYP